nr:glycoside hydrolase family 88 protein [uncultured Bacteroides sp.]
MKDVKMIIGNKKGVLSVLFLFLSSWCVTFQAQSLVRSDVRQSMRRVADWQIAHIKKVPYSDVNWVKATFYLGLYRWAEIAEKDNQDSFYFNWLMRLGSRNYWQVDKRMYHADDICVAQTYLLMYDKYKQPEMLIPTKARTEWVMANPPHSSFKLSYTDASTLEHWTWCDALFMAPPVYLHMYDITGDKKYIRFMDKEYKATYDYLFDKEESLFYRDWRYFTEKEANGSKVFWGRGNGWVLGGLVELLRRLPAESKYRPFYQDLFVRIVERVVRCQGKDGFWHASLLDLDSYPSPETSASGFFVYALAYGINEGLLSSERFLPVVIKGWNALLSTVEEDGKLGYVQPIGADPKKVTRQMTEVYGPGAFLLAGTEIYRLAQESPVQTADLSVERIREIASFLPVVPQGIGVSCEDRGFWDKMKQDVHAQQLLNEVPALLKQGMPPFVDSLYLHLNKTNVRLPGEQMMDARFQYLIKLTLAECLENNQRYIPAIEKALISLCEQNPWSIPAHDRNLQNYNGTDYYVDLVVATSGNSIAQCVSLLGNRLSPEVKARVQCAFSEKVFRPIRRCLEKNKPFWWFTMANNWNSVCLAGVTGAALALLPDREERAFFVAVAEKYHVYGMKGYADDGYCSEGVGYYNYGFRAYILLREEVCRATQGKIDFFRTPKFVRIARYGKKIQMLNGICPAYSDCRIGLSVDGFINNYCDNVLGTAPYFEKLVFPFTGHNNNLSLYSIELFPRQAWKMDMNEEMRQAVQEESDPLHSYYEKAGILVVRPEKESSCRLAISVKGGHNAENHNHNDIGSFAVSLGKETIAGDQGGPFSYPGDYFSTDAPEKYSIKGSYGHPVPLVDGVQQSTGAGARAIVLEKELTDTEDRFSIDLTSAYHTPKLEKLVRTFTYNRSSDGCFRVEDKFVANSPVRFGTALTTAAKWKQIDSNHLLLTVNDEKMIVCVEASGAVEFTSETIELNCPAYTRIGITLKKSSTDGYIGLSMIPQYP